MKGHGWPFKHNGNDRGGSEPTMNNFLFIAVLVKIWSIIKFQQGETVSKYNFKTFTEESATKIVALLE